MMGFEIEFKNVLEVFKVCLNVDSLLCLLNSLDNINFIGLNL